MLLMSCVGFFLTLVRGERMKCSNQVNIYDATWYNDLCGFTFYPQSTDKTEPTLLGDTDDGFEVLLPNSDEFYLPGQVASLLRPYAMGGTTHILYRESKSLFNEWTRIEVMTATCKPKSAR